MSEFPKNMAVLDGALSDVDGYYRLAVELYNRGLATAQDSQSWIAGQARNDAGRSSRPTTRDPVAASLLPTRHTNQPTRHCWLQSG